MRLFLLSLFAFLGSRIRHTTEGRPTQGVFWAANVLAALLFGLGHLPAIVMIVPLSPLVVTRLVLLNGLAGVAFGYLYVTRGLEAAILAHFVMDIVLHVLAPLVI
jgi:membrane protease YdiL (CAAX protease family)